MANHFGLKFPLQFGLRLGSFRTSKLGSGSAACPSVIGPSLFVCAEGLEKECIGYDLRIWLGGRRIGYR